ncbi:MAG: MtrB/PioB family outer membrane beta-barrel protein, partial [Acidobacteria bacterium]|nr:MtrB/PioB family outer membrane beta-barrel protein [Acidobacteriota bacterium]
MRIFNRTVLILAFALAPVAANAQTASSSDAPAVRGWADFGVRGSSLTGDASRYERYRDLGDGLFLEGFRLTSDKNGWILDLRADHAGRSDQRYLGTFVRPGKFKGYGMWDQIPMLLSRSTRTPYTEVRPGEFRLDDAVQLQLEDLSGTAQSDALFALVNGSPTFELKSKRHSAEGGFEFFPVPEASFKVVVKRTMRSGAQPYGGSFGHSQVAEFPATIDHTLTDFDASAELERGQVLLRGGYTGSWFKNDVTSIIFDNPIRGIDATNGSSAGRVSLPVGNTRLGVNGMVSIKMPKKSRLTAYASVSTLRDDNGMILPQTIN